MVRRFIGLASEAVRRSKEAYYNAKRYSNERTRQAAVNRGQAASQSGFPSSWTRGGTGQPGMSMTNSRPADHAGSAMGISFNAAKTTLSLGKRKSKLAKLLKQVQLRETSVYARFQKLTPGLYGFPTAGAPGYGFATKFLDAAGAYCAMPVYCLNLTSSCFSNNTDFTTLTCPLYRLFKHQTANAATDATLLNYRWTMQAGHDSEGADTCQYTIEKYNTINQGRPIALDSYIHDWSEVGLSLVNKTGFDYPVRFHVAVVSFKNPNAGPLRYASTAAQRGTVPSYPGAPNIGATPDVNDLTEEGSAADLWWDHFLANKTTHPLRNVIPMHKSNAVKIHSYKCICVEGKNNNVAAYTQRYFMRDGKMYYCVDPTVAEANHKPDLNVKGVNTTGLIAEKFNVMATNTSSIERAFPRREADKWLMIWSEAFSGTQAIDFNDNLIGFDLSLRNKFIYSAL